MSVNVFEVGPRDGLQNEKALVPLRHKLALIRGLIRAGIRDLELGAFVRADRVPQMSDTDAIFSEIRARRLKLGRVRAWSLVPNMQGLERAALAGAQRIAIFTASTDSFNRRNIGKTVRESLRMYAPLVRDAQAMGMEVRGYVSTAFGCPFEGKVAPRRALRVIEALGDMGVTQVSIGDTIGVADPKGVEAVIRPALKILGRHRTAGHFHDTRGTALANALRAIELGVRTIDSSAGGLGGCPFAPGATGNLATEDLVYMLNGMGVKTGIDLRRLSQLSVSFARVLKRPPASRYVMAFAAGTRR